MQYPNINPRPLQLATGAVGALATAYKAVKESREALNDAQEAYNYLSSFRTYRRMPSSLKSEIQQFRKISKTSKAVKFSKLKSNYTNNKMPRKYTKRKTTRKRTMRKRTQKGGLKQVKTQLRSIKKALKADQAYHTFKTVSTSQLLSTVNSVNYSALAGVDMATLETSMANLRYYDPQTPGTLVTANASTGTYSREIHFSSVYSGGTVVNNFQVPCEVKLYLCKVKSDTSITPTTYFSNGITDQVISGTASNIDLYPTEIDVLRAQYVVKCYKTKTLQPGQSFKFSHSVKNIDYDPSLFDSHSLTYQSKYKNFVWMIRVNGVIGHDTAVASQVGNLQAGIDIEQVSVYKITYDAGVNLNDIYISDSRDTFTNGGVVSNKPVSDNQGYSVS